MGRIEWGAFRYGGVGSQAESERSHTVGTSVLAKGADHTTARTPDAT